MSFVHSQAGVVCAILTPHQSREGLPTGSLYEIHSSHTLLGASDAYETLARVDGGVRDGRRLHTVSPTLSFRFSSFGRQRTSSAGRTLLFSGKRSSNTTLAGRSTAHYCYEMLVDLGPFVVFAATTSTHATAFCDTIEHRASYKRNKHGCLGDRYVVVSGLTDAVTDDWKHCRVQVTRSDVLD
jgi:hypothetical protein